MGRASWCALLGTVLLAALLSPAGAAAQERAGTREAGARVNGRVRDAAGGAVPAVLVTVEGSDVRARSDSAGEFVLPLVPPGPQTVRATRIGYAPARARIVVPARGTILVELVLARQALELERLVVTADPTGRARGELATATVVDRDAIENQGGASVAAVLEMVPGTPLAAPGLDAAQQATLRSTPLNGGLDPNSMSVRNRSAEELAAFGTPIIVDGVPVSNNANLQSLGVRGELALASTADGGIDLRRIPAATIERVEVLRGVPSVRYGDLTTAAILIETRAGAIPPSATLRYDARTTELSVSGGRERTSAARPLRQALSLTGDVARTRIEPGSSSSATTRLTANLAHRLVVGTARDSLERLTMDSHLDGFVVRQTDPAAGSEREDWLTGREAGLRLSTRARLAMTGGARVELTSALEGARQRSESGSFLTRAYDPISDRLTPGRTVGRFLGGEYFSRVSLEGEPRHLYNRLEASVPRRFLGFSHVLRLGGEARREWTGGAGYSFDPRFPPQSVTYRFDPDPRYRNQKKQYGLTGWDRPRRFDALTPLATSGLYLDDWATRALGGAVLQLQGGVRVDVLHRGAWWTSAARDLAVQPRLTGQFAPRPGVRLRLSGGRVAKSPAMTDLYPGLQWYDVPNLVWTPRDTAEWLTVLTTFAFDPTNPDLGYALADKVETGIEIDLGRTGGLLAISAYDDRVAGAVGVALTPTYVEREEYVVDDSTQGTGHPPGFVEPPYDVDTLPILLQRPANNVTLASRGIEIVLATPELPGLRTSLAVQGAWQRSRLRRVGMEVGPSFDIFQISPAIQRTPYWNGSTRLGERALVTTRLVHHQPKVGLVLTATVQHAIRDVQRDVAGTDTLDFAGYLQRNGRLVEVPREDRYMSQYQDLRHFRSGYLADERRAGGDWLMSVQVAKTLPRDARLMFWAFNALDRLGLSGDQAQQLGRPFAPMRYGVQLTAPLGW